MAQIESPPRPPAIAQRDDDGPRSLRFRLWQIFATGFTVLVTAWFCNLGIRSWPDGYGVLAAILALMIAKHVLVAILIVGLDQPQTHEAEG
jgi:hypothetical protein